MNRSVLERSLSHLTNMLKHGCNLIEVWEDGIFHNKQQAAKLPHQVHGSMTRVTSFCLFLRFIRRFVIQLRNHRFISFIRVDNRVLNLSRVRQTETLRNNSLFINLQSEGATSLPSVRQLEHLQVVVVTSFLKQVSVSYKYL